MTAQAPADAEAPDDEELEQAPDAEAPEGEKDASSGDEAANVTPDEQAAYDTVMTAVLGYLYGNDATHNAIVKKLQGAKDLATELGHTAAMILTSIDGAAQKQGREIPDDVIFHAGEETVSELIDIAIAANLASESNRDELYKYAGMEATRAFGSARMTAGRVSPDEMAEAGQTFRTLQQGGKGEGAQAAQGAPKPAPQSPVAAAKQRAMAAEEE